MRPRKEPIERFMRFVSPEPNSGCWLWTGGLMGLEYPSFYDGEKYVKGHRWAYEYFVGPIPDFIEGQDSRGPCVLHKCDVPSCVNPDHLFIGTHAANMADMKAKKRANGSGQMGTRNGQSCLTEDDVRSIRKMWKHGKTCDEIAATVPISRSMVHLIASGKSWKHVQ